MAEETKTDRVTLEELMVSTLAMTDALAKLMIAKGHHRRRVQSTVNHGAGELSCRAAVAVIIETALIAQRARRTA
jgi:hypothetical protein